VATTIATGTPGPVLEMGGRRSVSHNMIRLVRDGLASGAIGFVTIVGFFTLVDVLASRSLFYTPALLGGALFYGVTSPAEIVVARGPVLAYSAAHLAAFLVIGALAAGLAAVATRYRHVWYLGVNLFLLVIAHASGVVLTLTESLEGIVSGWLVAGATLVAAATMALYLLWANPPLLRELRDPEYRES
jgi:hypothetical protein